MQFYMIDQSAAKSVAALPDAMIRVNVREGWQILSDIGHHLRVTWPGQNKCYNANHPTTMRHRESADDFLLFADHYLAALTEWRARFSTDTVWHIRAAAVPWEALHDKLWGTTRWTTMRDYIRLAKTKQLTTDELAKLS